MEEGTKTSVAAAALVVTLGAAVAWYLLRPERPAPAPLAATSVPAAPAASSLPPLDQSDILARQRLSALGKLPASWLAVDNVVRRLVAAAQILGEGGSPRESLSFLRPAEPFSVRKKDGRAYLDPKSYRRYDVFASAVDSIDAKAAARVVSELSPLFAQACGELDDRRCDFAASTRKAAALLADTPVLKEPVPLRKKVVTWGFADPKLEALTPAQKHLLRMGPDNELKVQAKLKELSAALEPRP